MRAAAEVGERAVAIERHGRQRVGGIGVADEVLDQLHLVALVLAAEARERLVDADVTALERLVGIDVRAHRPLDALEVCIRDADVVREVEVVVEAVGDRRADRDLHAGIQLAHRGREHVGGVVADQRQRVVVTRRDDLDRGAVGQRCGEIAQLAVDANRERRSRQPRADRARRVSAAGAVVELQLVSVGERHVHGRARCYCERARPAGASTR